MRLNIADTSLAVFQFREYRIFWLAAAFSNIGIWALIFGRLWLMRSLTDSEFLLGMVTMANLGPILFLSMWGGVLADRVNRLHLVRITRALFAALALLTALLIAIDVITPWQVIVIAFVEGVLLSFDIPSRAAMVSTIVPREHLAGAIAMYSIVFGASQIIGPMTFAPLVGAFGMEGVFVVIGVAYALTVVSLLFMTPQGHRVQSGEVRPPWQDLREGFGYLRGNTQVAAVIGLGIFAGLVGFSYQTLLPVFTDTIFLGDESTYGNLLLAQGIGGMIATTAVILRGRRVRPTPYLVVSGVLFGSALIAFASFDAILLASVMLAVIGASRVVYQTMNQTLVQTLVPAEYRGRMLGIGQFSWGATSLGGLLMGGLAQYYGAPFAFVVGGALMVAAVVIVGATVFRPRREVVVG